MYRRPMSGYLYFAPSERLLSQATELIIDIPGGGFIAMYAHQLPAPVDLVDP